jgi:hypothetical protein
MLNFSNATPWSGGLYPGWDRKQDFQITAVFKVGFEFALDGTITPLTETPALVETDEHYGKALETSLKAANETVPFKEGGEVYLFGTAYPLVAGQNITEVGLGIAFPDERKFKKVLRVFGKREWNRTMMNFVMSEPKALEPTPLKYEFAFGGRNPEDKDDEFPLNPVGLGFNDKGWKLLNAELPRIEQAPYFVKGPSNKPPPAGFGPIPVFWQPRIAEIGEPVDELAEQGGCPYNEQVEKTLHNAAPPDQRFPKPFEGGEIVHLAGFFKELELKQVVRLRLPKVKPQLYTIVDNVAELLNPVCDTLVINTDERRFYLIFRAAISADKWEANNGWVVLKDQDQLARQASKERNEAQKTARR